MNPMLERDIREYVGSNVIYPKRYKVRPRVYFIIIKTEAETMEDFKEKKAVRPASPAPKQELPALVRLNEERFGWYEGALDFKRIATRISWLVVRLYRVWTATIALLTI